MRLYSKKVPAKEASKQFIDRVRRQIPESDRRERVSEDVQKSRFSHQDWAVASEKTSTKLDNKVREPQN